MNKKLPKDKQSYRSSVNLNEREKKAVVKIVKDKQKKNPAYSESEFWREGRDKELAV